MGEIIKGRICEICQNDKIFLVCVLKPYYDKEWVFNIFECHNCGCRFADRIVGKDYHSILHDDVESPYSSHYTNAEKMKKCKNLEELRKIVISKPKFFYAEQFIRNKVKKGGKVMEIGASTGFFTYYLRKLGYESFGVDVSEKAVNFSNKTFGNYYSTDLGQFSADFDCIIFLGVIGCVDDPKEFLNSALNKIKIGGFIFFNAPSMQSLKNQSDLWLGTPPPDLKFIFSKRSLRIIFNKLSIKNFRIYHNISIRESIIKSYYYMVLGNVNNYPISYSANIVKNSIVSKIKKAFIGFLSFKWVQMLKSEFGLYCEIKKV